MAHQSVAHAPGSSGGRRGSESGVATGELLSLFGDDYTCEILRSLASGPASARAIVETTGISRPTVYRRLDRLSDAGLVGERLAVSADGHHRTEFRLLVERVAFEVAADGIDGHVETRRPADD